MLTVGDASLNTSDPHQTIGYNIPGIVHRSGRNLLVIWNVQAEPSLGSLIIEFPLVQSRAGDLPDSLGITG